MINICTNFIHSVLLPASCMACGQTTHQPRSLCQQCQALLPINQQPCPRCALPDVSNQGLECARCQRQPPLVQQSHVPLLYREPVKQWIQRFKFHADLVAGQLLADLFIDSLDSSTRYWPDVLVPVPLHPSRVRQRGFNQASWLAQRIGQATGIPLADWQIRRVRRTPDQHNLPRRSRLRNLTGSFSCDPIPATQTVAIVDDVVTTGATAQALASTLQQQGAETVLLWALARTPQD